MKRIVAAFGLLLATAALTPATAQFVCTTNVGTCPMGAGTPGKSCFCATRTGPIQGIVQSVGDSKAAGFPQFCCTPAGRIGPIPNNSVKAGQMCQARTAAGMVSGQACY